MMEFDEFKTLLNNILEKEDGCLSTNFGDEWYWEYWSIKKLDNEKYEVGFHIGSYSGWIPDSEDHKEVTIEDLYELFKAQDNLGEFSMLEKLSDYYNSL